MNLSRPFRLPLVLRLRDVYSLQLYRLVAANASVFPIHTPLGQSLSSFLLQYGIIAEEGLWK